MIMLVKIVATLIEMSGDSGHRLPLLYIYDIRAALLAIDAMPHARKAQARSMPPLSPAREFRTYGRADGAILH